MQIKLNKKIKDNALLARDLKLSQFRGGTMTGFMRMNQLINDTHINLNDLREIRNWFARHIYTSYPSYLRWQLNNNPMTDEYKNLGGIFSWLAWGGNDMIDLINRNTELLNNTFETTYEKLRI